LAEWSSDWDDTFNLRMIRNSVGEYYTQARGMAVVQLAGDIGNSNPKWEWHMSANYMLDRRGCMCRSASSAAASTQHQDAFGRRQEQCPGHL
jgi:hypothetical protein